MERRSEWQKERINTVQGYRFFKESYVKKLVSRPFVKVAEGLFIVICFASAACLYQSVDFFESDTE